jgi:hypothetical protein
VLEEQAATEHVAGQRMCMQERQLVLVLGLAEGWSFEEVLARMEALAVPSM